jgi:hypothetical protein
LPLDANNVAVPMCRWWSDTDPIVHIFIFRASTYPAMYLGSISRKVFMTKPLASSITREPMHHEPNVVVELGVGDLDAVDVVEELQLSGDIEAEADEGQREVSRGGRSGELRDGEIAQGDVLQKYAVA